MGSGSPAPSSALLASTMRVNGLQASGVRSIMFTKPGYQLLGLARSRASNKSVTVRACIIARGRERVAQEPHGPSHPSRRRASSTRRTNAPPALGTRDSAAAWRITPACLVVLVDFTCTWCPNTPGNLLDTGCGQWFS